MVKRLDLLNRIGNLYDSHCRSCPVKKARDGNRRKGGVYVRTDKERCDTCFVEKAMKKLRAELEGGE